MSHVIVIGGGVAGLASALALGRRGHQVTVVEQDELPSLVDPDAAFEAARRGAPQVHQTHGFLARLQVALREEFPDVFEELLAAGGTTMPTTAALGPSQPGDQDLKVIIVRRTTLEWVLRRAALQADNVRLIHGCAVDGLLSTASHPPMVTGVRLATGSVMEADLVVAANGRRSALPGWLHEIGSDIPETVEHSGLMYLTRWYRLPPDRQVDLDPKLGGDLGFVKYLGVPGDGHTLSVTLAIRSTDTDLRVALSSGRRFDHACSVLPGPDRFFRAGPLEPIGEVRPMGGLLNRMRRFTLGDGTPRVLGLHAVGDAHTCTNPLYGRGCSLAVVQALLLRDALDAQPDDPAARAIAYEAACRRHVLPWYKVSVQMDRLGADPAGFSGGAEAKAMAAVLAAGATDPVIGRGLLRFWNLMATPKDLAGDTEFLARVTEVMAEPERWPLQPPAGPSREQLLEALRASETAA